MRQSTSQGYYRYLCHSEEVAARIEYAGPAGLNTIVVGDCLEVLTMFPDASVDLIHTSPPYNIGKDYAGFEDSKSLHEYREFLGRVIKECYRVLKPNGSMFFQTGYSEANGEGREIYPIDMLSYDLFKDAGFKLWDRIIWHYFGGMSFTRKFKNSHETILWWVRPGSDGAAPYFNVDAVRERSRSYDKRNNLWGKNPGNVWIEDRVAFGSTRRDTSHIAVYPEGITERIIRACSEPGQLVLDPFAGSGTTPMMARALGRRWCGIEISPTYAEEAAYRVGTRQPSEVGNLASGLLKAVGFENAHRPMPVDTLARRLLAWVQSLPFDEFEQVWQRQMERVGLVGPQNDEVKEQKPEVWSFFDNLFIDPSPSFRQLVYASKILDSLYPQRRLWNSVRKYDHTLRALGEIGRRTSSTVSSEDLVVELATEEPSSYEIDRNRMVVEFHGKPMEPYRVSPSQNGQHTASEQTSLFL